MFGCVILTFTKGGVDSANKLNSTFAECDTSLYSAIAPPSNSETPSFPTPFLPGTAVDYVCMAGFEVRGEQTFTCSAADGSFSPTTPPTCEASKFGKWCKYIFRYSAGLTEVLKRLLYT